MPRSSSDLNKNPPPRVVIESVRPQVEEGRYPVKRAIGDELVVEADVFADGHGAVAAELLFKFSEDRDWSSIPMDFRHNDHWAASFRVEKPGRYQYTVRGWTDAYLTWQRDLEKRKQAGQDTAVELQIGEQLAGRKLVKVSYDRTLEVVVDPVRARFSAWYEMFPRSARGDGKHATFKDVVAKLDYVQELGFDVLYLPPVHPIGVTARKGKNDAVEAQPGDVGSPWAIGGREGGHKALHPDLGTFEDFHALVREAEKRGMQIALDIAFQCSPDHPYVRSHPDWFRRRPDGTVQYAENPPKKYQDIYPFEFESPDWKGLWQELKSVFEFWIGHGVKIFRIDNPHTKPFAFWEWVIAELKNRHPELIFLSEAFTRPRLMHRLAKLGFTQSYTYFTWRNTKHELVEYFSELASSPCREYFRPNAWPNTPDILHKTLQKGGRPAFITRAVLAATLAANWGMYGPAFELQERTPREPGSEEYLDSEKYEIKRWDLARADSIAPLVARLNRIRKDNPALQRDWSLKFHPVDNDQLLVFSKSEEQNEILVAVNLDPRHPQSGRVEFPPCELHELLSGGRTVWGAQRNPIELSPHTLPAHVFRVTRK